MTHTISFERGGHIRIDPYPETSRIVLTDKAYEKITKENIRYIYELQEDFDILPDGRFGLAEENPYCDDILKGSLFTMRIRNIPKLRPELVERDYKDIDEILPLLDNALYGNETTRIADIVAVLFLSRTKPIWTINEITPEAATLISKARLDENLLNKYIPKVKQGLFLKAKTGTLTTGASEILAVDELLCVGHKIGKRTVAFGLGDEEDLAFCAKFLALQESENRPVVIRDSQDKVRKQGFRMTRGVNTRIISLSSRYSYRKLGRGEKIAQGESDSSSWKEGKIKTVVSVSGFIREQAYGEGRKLRKTIWVDGFERGQWVRQGLSVITIRK